MRCSDCGNEIVQISRFCPDCGVTLDASDASDSQDPPAASEKVSTKSILLRIGFAVATLAGVVLVTFTFLAILSMLIFGTPDFGGSP